MAKPETMLRGILTSSEILDYLTKEDVEKKIGALMEKDAQYWAERSAEFDKTISSSLPGEEKERLMIDMMNERISGQKAVEKEQRMIALQIRRDYEEFKKHEEDAFKAVISGDFRKYDRSIVNAAKASDMVDMGLEFIENAHKFFSNFKVTKMKISPLKKDARADGADGS
jgi:hypothetical protein